MFILTCGLYYKPMTIVNDDSRVINKLEASLTDDARVVIYNCHMFIVRATEVKFLVICEWLMNELSMSYE
jgi:hypothetical protein